MNMKLYGKGKITEIVRTLKKFNEAVRVSGTKNLKYYENRKNNLAVFLNKIFTWTSRTRPFLTNFRKNNERQQEFKATAPLRGNRRQDGNWSTVTDQTRIQIQNFTYIKNRSSRITAQSYKEQK